jgi:DNA-binding SARP family transcriptional activator
MSTIADRSDLAHLSGATPSNSPPSPEGAVLSAHFLGEFRVAINHMPVPLGTSRRTRTLLAFVIDRAPRPIARDLLMEVFWPASTPDAARNSLHVAIRAVRKALSHSWPGVVIECRGDTYRLAESVSLWTDVAELERRSEWAAEASARGCDDEAMQHYEAALALYGEEFLADDPYLEWAVDRREEIRLRAVTCAERLSALHLERGDLRRALVVSSQVLREEPCHEPVARRLMVAYARLGEPHMALRQYERIVDVLDRDLGVEPAPETVALADGIRRRLPV